MGQSNNDAGDEQTNHRHFIIHKPFNYHSQFVLNNNKKKDLLGQLFNFPEGTMAIGRLDKTSEGLLFLTTDGMMSHRVRSKKVEKEYYVQVDGLIEQVHIDHLTKGVVIGFDGQKYTTKPCKAYIHEKVSIYFHVCNLI